MSERTREPHGHEFHKAAFVNPPLQDAISALMAHLAQTLTADRTAGWTNALVAVAFVEPEHQAEQAEGDRDRADQERGQAAMTGRAWLGNDTETHPVDVDTFAARDLLADIDRIRTESDSNWNLLALRLSRTDPTTLTVATQVRGWPLPDPVGALYDEDTMHAMLTGQFPT